ncbi:unnamed protein product [Phytomonas sp. Hart1]|nr:unnamed protein product [Phytomonas sp. Hart1]|eukprot:CCW66949.1 unnamed protein product [Phytomonas sp. isolate Hart1]
MAIEKTLFPPIPGTKMEKSFYKKLKTHRNRIPKEVIESGSEAFYSFLGDDESIGNLSTSAILKRTLRILTSMSLPAAGMPVESKKDLAKSMSHSGTDRFLYINGNLIDLENSPLFVASQAPIASGISDFLATLYKYKIQLVIMLTKTVEDEIEKADQYWVSENNAALFDDNHVDNTEGLNSTCSSLFFRDMKVSLNPEEPYYADKRLDLIYRPLLIQPQSGGAVMPLLHIQYTGWPDLGVPSSAVALCELFKIVDAYQDTAPVLVHCSAGVGRTGTFIGTYAILQAIRNGRFENETLYQTVMSMRCARYYMVQRIEQYLFMYQIILTKLNLDMSEFAANLQESVFEYQQEVTRTLLLKKLRNLVAKEESSNRTCLDTNSKRERNK